MYLNSLNYFRAIAIIFIVAIHCAGLANFSTTSYVGNTFSNLIAGGTCLFVFISGFLFHHVFYKKFNFKKFYSKKLKFVFLPYVLIALVPTLISVFGKEYSPIPSSNYFAPKGPEWFDLYVIPTLKYYVTGALFIAYWYIPFVMLLFLFSPLHYKFIALPLRMQLAITTLLVVVASFAHRPYMYTSSIVIFQSLLYYTPIYLIGILASIKKEFIYKNLKGKEHYLLLIVVGLAFLYAFLGKVGSPNKALLEYDGVDLIFIQKIILSLFFMVWLHRFEDRKFKVLSHIADTSFGIFFIHCLLLIFCLKMRNYFDISFPPDNLFIYVMVTIVILAVSYGIVKIIQKLFPKYSRYLIGS